MSNAFSLSKLARLFKSANAGTSVAVDASGNPIAYQPQSGFKNKIIGGDFTTNPWQRGTSYALTGTFSYGFADRFASARAAGNWTVSRSTSAPTGFGN